MPIYRIEQREAIVEKLLKDQEAKEREQLL
jgi:hypothetical protein